MLWVLISLQELPENVGVGRTLGGDEFLGLPCLILVGYEHYGHFFLFRVQMSAGPGMGKGPASTRYLGGSEEEGLSGCRWNTAQAQPDFLLPLRVYQEAML